jgi:hypothetical protein
MRHVSRGQPAHHRACSNHASLKCILRHRERKRGRPKIAVRCDRPGSARITTSHTRHIWSFGAASNASCHNARCPRGVPSNVNICLVPTTPTTVIASRTMPRPGLPLDACTRHAADVADVQLVLVHA